MSKIEKKLLNRIPTKRIKEILNENYCRGVNGAEYEDCKEELQHIIWEREDREIERQVEERQQYYG